MSVIGIQGEGFATNFATFSARVSCAVDKMANHALLNWAKKHTAVFGSD
jgi:hypothetical protein